MALDMKMLDLFCGAGGASVGYKLAYPDLDITGVDIHPQPHYPFRFVRGDANSSPLDGFDIIHASPPCEGHTISRWAEYESRDFLFDTIRRLRLNNSWLWVVENVTGAFMDEHFMLCGASLGHVLHDERLYLKRHRKFWSNQTIAEPACTCLHWKHQGYRCGGVHGGSGGLHRQGRGYRPGADTARRLMGIDWMNRRELAQSIPPSYTQHILTQALAQ
jgi:DNA (cytosine-5)-methyltransferase 1